MEITRNQYYLAGLVLLFLGIQFRMIDTIDLTPDFTQFLAERSGHPLAAVSATAQSMTQADKPLAKKTVRPPEWLRLVAALVRQRADPAQLGDEEARGLGPGTAGSFCGTRATGSASAFSQRDTGKASGTQPIDPRLTED